MKLLVMILCCCRCSQFHPNKPRRHTVSVDNLDEIENIDDEDIGDESDIDIESEEEEQENGTEVDDVSQHVPGNHCILNKKCTQRAQTSADPEDLDFGRWTPRSEA